MLILSCVIQVSYREDRKVFERSMCKEILNVQIYYLRIKVISFIIFV